MDDNKEKDVNSIDEAIVGKRGAVYVQNADRCREFPGAYGGELLFCG